MEVPLEVISWLRRKYPKPKVDPEWLSQCFEYVVTELNPSSMDETNRHVQTQLLASDLRDSMLPGTGAPSNIAELDNAFLAGPVLVQILAITDIGHSAFSLQTTRQTRIDKADLAGLAEAEGDSEEEDANRIPKYPRGMLRFELSDGSQTFPAIEYRRIKDLELGVTPLGYKICLKNVFFRRGIAFLEPSNTQMEGSRVEELEENQDKDFVAGLNMRLGRPIDEEEQTQQTLVASPPRVPLGDIDVPMATADATAPTAYEHDDDSQRRRKVPASSTLAQPSTLGASPYFTNTSSTLNNPPVASTSNAIDVDIDDFELHSDDIDEQFLAELDSVEQAYSQAPPMSQPTTTLRQVISIDDDDEEDKENVVSPQRRVRRRVEDRVIDISD